MSFYLPKAAVKQSIFLRKQLHFFALFAIFFSIFKGWAIGLAEKLFGLADAAKYDGSCSSGERARRKFGNGHCHAYTAGGRCDSLLKILLANRCISDCAYCASGMQDFKAQDCTPERTRNVSLSASQTNTLPIIHPN